ncbi:predicted protein [Plenodomus lingam JN3]|uniref:Predicted protein n=1 Tax=Leptosphaeria maculans (strain JN3 / isolate v23.1.3 / race Av1-4-5-6-7-8) TaxID=985895 RepID=E4ZN23_LEPMJ|nr:predicted protein [Plenodomus lingam JN3]CBX92626.1 predicted protein [Plenodomus lingam JN3]
MDSAVPTLLPIKRYTRRKTSLGNPVHANPLRPTRLLRVPRPTATSQPPSLPPYPPPPPKNDKLTFEKQPEESIWTWGILACICERDRS